jgi:hypothetical protein
MSEVLQFFFEFVGGGGHFLFLTAAGAVRPGSNWRQIFFLANGLLAGLPWPCAVL